MSGIELVERSVQHIRYVNHISLSDKKREVSDHVVGYIANKFCEGCEKQLVDESN